MITNINKQKHIRTHIYLPFIFHQIQFVSLYLHYLMFLIKPPFLLKKKTRNKIFTLAKLFNCLSMRQVCQSNKTVQLECFKCSLMLLYEVKFCFFFFFLFLLEKGGTGEGQDQNVGICLANRFLMSPFLVCLHKSYTIFVQYLDYRNLLTYKSE